MTDLEAFAHHTIEQGGQWRELEPGLYKSQNWRLIDNRNYFGDVPVYQVFDGNGKRIFASTNYQSALEFWRRLHK